MKKISEEEVIRRVAYEVSVSKLELLDDEMQMHGREENMGMYQVLPT